MCFISAVYVVWLRVDRFALCATMALRRPPGLSAPKPKPAPAGFAGINPELQSAKRLISASLAANVPRVPQDPGDVALAKCLGELPPLQRKQCPFNEIGRHKSKKGRSRKSKTGAQTFLLFSDETEYCLPRPMFRQPCSCHRYGMEKHFCLRRAQLNSKAEQLRAEARAFTSLYSKWTPF